MSSLRDSQALNTPYIDLYLIHWPFGFAEDTSELQPVDENNETRLSNVDFLETWREMEELVRNGELIREKSWDRTILILIRF